MRPRRFRRGIMLAEDWMEARGVVASMRPRRFRRGIKPVRYHARK